MRPWQAAMADYAPVLRTGRADATAARPAPRPDDDGRPAGDRSRPPAVRPRWRPLRRDRPVRGPARLVPRALARGRVRDDRPGRRPAPPPAPSPGSCRPTSPPRRSGVLRGLHLHQRQLDHWVVASGRAFVALVDVRPMLRGDATARSSRRASSGRRMGRHPDRRRPRLPRARAPAADLPRDERVRRERRAGLRLGRSARRRCRGRPSREPRTAARSCPTATARTRRSPSSWSACAPPAESLRARSGPHRTAPCPTRHAHRATRRGYSARDHAAIETTGPTRRGWDLPIPALIPGVPSCAVPSPPWSSS